MRTRAQASEPTALDVPYIAEVFGLPEVDVQTLLDAPTADLVQAFLQSVQTKAQDYDSLRAEKLRVDVELDNTLRTSETKVKAQKSQVAKHVKEVEELRTKLNESDAARENLAAELEHLRSNASGSTAETQTLRQRIESLEASNRDALSLVEAKTSEKDRLAAELSEQHGKLLVLKKEASALEEKSQGLENAISSQKFKEQSLQQELDLARKNSEWQRNELQTRSNEHNKFRKDRNARIAALQRDFEEASANVEILKRTETTLRQRLDSAQEKADEAFARIASVQEEAARKERDSRMEIDSTRRLADLQAQSAATHKARLNEVQGQMEQTEEAARVEISQLQAEVETERSEREAVERKVAELEVTVERLEQSRPAASRPGTPQRNGALDLMTPGRFGAQAGSPIPGSVRKIVGGLSFTQLYSKYTEAQSELEAEQRRTKKLTETLDEMIAEMEGRQPELLEMRAEHERLEGEVLEYSRLLDASNETRDVAIKDAERVQGEVEAAVREGNVLRQQLRDLSAQIKMLLVELQSKDQGLGELSAQERLELERVARGEFTEEALAGMTDTDRFVSERLVLFRGVAELQERNIQLISLTRSLGEKMEGEEAREKDRQTAADHDELIHLRRQVERYKDELQATAVQIDSYMKERDMFRRMLQHRGQLHPDADLQSLFGESVGPAATPLRNNNQIEPATPRSKDAQDMHRLLKEHQTTFDQFRTEALADRKQFKDQVDRLLHDKSTLQGDIARAQSQLQLAGERHDMLQQNYQALRNENNELQKRSSQLYQQLTTQESKTNQVAEDLVEARSMTESLRNDNANTKAEKELWKRVEARLQEDNKTLMDERSRLNKLVTDLQNLQNERELAESENRRRLQGKTEALETELVEAKRRAGDATEDYKRLSQRRELDESERRKREDDLTRALSNVREELVAARTSRDQLQTRVDEMKIELRSAEERVAALQPRPTLPTQASQSQNGDGEPELSPEQRLSLEVSELRRDLELANNELEAARREVDQYRSIAQATEEELASFNETSEQYKAETDRLVTEKDSRIQELERRSDELGSELATTNNELSELRTTQEDASKLLDEQKAGFESELSRLRDDADRHTEEKKLYQEDLKAQAEIAQQAQQSYENELVKHADAAKSLQDLRQQYHELRADVAKHRAEAEAAKASLDRSEESWKEQQNRLEAELEEAQRRKSDVDEQNRLLHQQMESFSADLQSLRQGRNFATSPSDEQETAAAPSSLDGGNLQEVIRFLRREKEIVDVQYELSVQEGRRVQQQLDYANTQLEETRQKLAEERRQSTDRLASEGSTSKLMEEIQQLNLYRESNESLRNSLRRSEENLTAARLEIDRAVTEVEPLKARLADLEGEVEGKESEMKLLQDDRDHWRERTQNIISKYDRVDPAELEEMRNRTEELLREKETLLQEKEALQNETDPLKEQLANAEARVQTAVEDERKTFTTRLEKFKEQAKEQNRKQNNRIAELTGQLNDAKAEVERLTAELQSARAEQLQAEESRKAATAESQKPAQTETDTPVEEGEVAAEGSSEELHAQLHAKIADAETRAAEHSSQAASLTQKVETLESQVRDLQSEVATLQQQLEAAQASNSSADAPAPQLNSTTDQRQEVEELQKELAVAKEKVDNLQSTTVTADAGTQAAGEVSQAKDEVTVANQVAQEVERLRSEMEQQHELAKKQMEEDFAKRTANMKEQLNTKLREGREKANEAAKSEVAEKHSAELEKLRSDHAAAIEKLKQEHQAEMERLRQEGMRAVDQAELKDTKTNEDVNVKAEPVSPSKIDFSKVDFSALDITDDQAKSFIQSNRVVKRILTTNITKRVEEQTKALTAQIAEKDAEIERLKATQSTLPPADTNATAGADIAEQLKQVTAERDELAKKLEQAETDKKKAIEVALEQREKKLAVQLNMRDVANAKIQAVTKAYNETPEKTIKEVWDVAKTAKVVKPTPKPAPAPAPASPVPAQAPPAAAAPSTNGQTEDKMKERAERFGAPSPVQGATPATFTGTFGQPSVTGGQGSFGQPSGTFGQPSQSNRSSLNPQLPAFTPGNGTNAQGIEDSASGGGPAAPKPVPQASGIPRGSASQLPRAGGAAGRGGAQGAGAQGAASGGARGGAQSGLPRGGANAARGGGARGRGGGPGNAGQKRQHEGGGEGGDSKRTRGGGGPGGA